VRRRFTELMDKSQKDQVIISGTIGIAAKIGQFGTSVGFLSKDGEFYGGGIGTISCNLGDDFVRGLFTDSTYRVMFYAFNNLSEYLLYPYTWSNIRITIGSRTIDTGSHSMNDGGVNLIVGEKYGPPANLNEFAKYFYNLRGSYNYQLIFQK
jgi:hypothetical protein